jgi:N-acetylmuramate 1-kinase
MDFINTDDLLYHTRRHLRGWEDAEVHFHHITKGGSDRHYFRLTAAGKFRGPKTVMLMAYTTRRPDNASFFASTEVLRSNEIPCPRVFAHDPDHMLAWIEDLGEVDLWEIRNGDEEFRLQMYRDALIQAGKLHSVQRVDVPESLNSSLQADFDEGTYSWEQNYFFDNFALPFSAMSPEALIKVRLQPEFAEAATRLAAMPRFLVHRDFQSQNVVVQNGKTLFIDHQGLRGGRPEYDLASLLYDPYVEFTEDQRDDLAEFYFANRPQHDKWDTNQEIYALCVCQRLMQALGAYGFLGLKKDKPKFLGHIPAAVANLSSVLKQVPGLFPGLLEVLTVKDGIDFEDLAKEDEVEEELLAEVA